MAQEPTPMELRNAFLQAKRLHSQGLISTDALYAAADAYIIALKDYRRSSKRQFAIPTRAYLIRSL
jgi:hypothetical protein